MTPLPAGLNKVKELLQGKGLLSHPIHVAINHVPLGLWEGSIVFDLMSRQRKWRKLSEAGYYLNLFGIFAAVPTAATGVAEWADIPSDHPAWKVATTHAVLNDIALGISLYNWWTRRNRRNFAPDQTNLIMSGVLVGVLGVSGYLGGVLAHEYGYGTHRQGTAIEKERESLVGPQAQINEPKIVLTGDGTAAGSLDSWEGVQEAGGEPLDESLEAEREKPPLVRETGGSGI